MMRVAPIIRTMMLVTSLSMSALCRANADTIVTLEGVTFADGATAAGYFVLNVDGYMESAEITTSAAISMAALPMAGYSYTAAGSTVPSGPGPFDTVFWFNSTIDDFSLVLTADYPVTAGGSDPLVPGSGSGAPRWPGRSNTAQRTQPPAPARAFRMAAW
jgi:hypothetical protein